MEAIFHWQSGAWSNSVERDEMAEQSNFLSFPHLSANTLENTLGWEKNVPLSQSMSALNAHCSAGHLLTLAASQGSCFSKRATSLWTGSLLWETQSSLVFQVSETSFHVCLFLHEHLFLALKEKHNSTLKGWCPVKTHRLHHPFTPPLQGKAVETNKKKIEKNLLPVGHKTAFAF